MNAPMPFVTRPADFIVTDAMIDEYEEGVGLDRFSVGECAELRDAWITRELERGQAGRESPDSGAMDLPHLPFELFGSIKPRLDKRWLIKRLLMASGSCVAFGLPGAAKSFLAVSMGLHIAAGEEWFGRAVTQAPVVYLAAEGQTGLRLRVDAWKRAHGYCDKEIPFALIPVAADLLDPAGDVVLLQATLAMLAELFGGIGLLIVDTLAASFGGGDENGPDMAAYLGNVARVCAPYGCARLIITHAPLAEGAKRPRGHGSLWGGADTVVHVIGDSESPARRAKIIKQKDDDPGQDILFRLESVLIGTDEDGEEVRSCTVEPFEDDLLPMTSGGKRLSAKQRIALDQLGKLLIEDGITPPAGIPDTALDRRWIGKVADLSEWRTAVIAALHSPDSKPDTARRQFDRARDELQACKAIGIFEEYVWLEKWQR